MVTVYGRRVYFYTVQSYTIFSVRGIANRTMLLQQACKFLASGCKKHCKLYTACKIWCKNFVICIIGVIQIIKCRRGVGIYIYLLFCSAIVGVVGTEAGGEGRCLFGFVGMVGDVLLVVGQAQTVDVAGEGAEAALEGERDVGAAQLTDFQRFHCLTVPA